ncbi:hypothetical protein [Paracoccus aerius]|nr:hypothetical protein [Paracoccus aerius]
MTRRPSLAGEGRTQATNMRDILIEAAAFALTALIAFGLAVAEHP